MKYWRVGVVAIAACASPGNGPTLRVAGSTQFVTNTGVVSVPIDFTGATFTAVDSTVDSSQWYSKTVSASGPFDLLLPADADHWLVKWGVDGSAYAEYFAGTGGTLDLSYVQLGRPDAVFTSTTNVALDATGLAPWASGDQIEVVNASAGAVEIPPLAISPAIGATTATGLSVPWLGGEIDASKDPPTLVYQLAPATAGAYAAITTLATVPFSMVGGGLHTLDASLSPVTPDETLSATFQRSAFEALRADFGPNVEPTAPATSTLYVDTLPTTALPAASGFQMSTPDLVVDQSAASVADLALDYSYSNPVAPQGGPWSEYAIASYNFEEAIPGFSSWSDGTTTTIPIEAVRDGVIAPLISPPTALQINGDDAYGSTISVGATPTLSWQPPGLGPAAAYELWIYEVNPFLGNGSIVYTAGTSFDIPDGLLIAGKTYVGRVVAISSPSYSVTTPFIEPLPDGRASATTGPFTR